MIKQNSSQEVDDQKLNSKLHGPADHILNINSLSPERNGNYSKYLILHHTLMNDILGISREIPIMWIPQDITNDVST